MVVHPALPEITLSSTAVRLRRPSTIFRVSERTGIAGVDLDLSDSMVMGRTNDMASAVSRFNGTIHSVWMPRSTHPVVWTGSNVHHEAMEVVQRTGARVVLRMPVAAHAEIKLAAITRLTETMRASLDGSARIMVALDRRWIIGGRAPLVQMTALRRLAEEWDFEIGLDLTGRLDPTWETEAAILRLGRRLVYLRIATLPAPHRVSNAHDRLTARALAASLESGSLQTVALAPASLPWHRLVVGATAIACDELAGSVRTRQRSWLDGRVTDRSVGDRAPWRS